MDNTRSESKIDKLISENNIDGFVQYKDGDNVNHQYLTGFEASDLFTYLRYNNESTLLVAPVEKGKAQDQSNTDQVRSTAEFVNGDVRDDIESEAYIISSFLTEYDIDSIGVPRNFDLYIYEVLENNGISVQTVPDVVMDARKQKSKSEIELMRNSQIATEKAMNKAKDIIRQSEVRQNELYYNDDPLTSEKLKDKLKDVLSEYDCHLDESIVACGKQSVDPHKLGSGKLRPNKPIIIDIYPQHKSGYWGDMTRTFVKGEPDDQFKEMYKMTREAFESALDMLSNGSGVKAQQVHNMVCDVFESTGYPTIRDGDIDRGFLHSTGHGIGLELHEPPRIADNDEVLEEGYVLTLEPGLYDSEYGGVRIEDMIVITEDGYENLNDFEYDYQV